MGFKGYINTDSGVHGNNAFGVEKLTLPERFAKAVKAGVSLFSDNNDPKELIDAVNQHLLKEEDLNASVTYLLTEIFRLGLFEEPYTDPEKAQAIANSPASAARAGEAHRKSIVLLRNDKKLLPITGARNIYVETFAEAAAGTGGGGGRGRGAFGPQGDVAGAAQGEAAAGGRGAGPQTEGGRGRGQGRAGGARNGARRLTR